MIYHSTLRRSSVTHKQYVLNLAETMHDWIIYPVTWFQQGLPHYPVMHGFSKVYHMYTILRMLDLAQ